MMIRELLRVIFKKIMLLNHKNSWRIANKHNKTVAVNRFPINKVVVGNFTYGPLDISFFGGKDEFVRIGSFCSIAENVKILAGGEHEYCALSTYPIRQLILKKSNTEAKSKGPVIIEDDVWIGYGAIILSGSKIGQGSIIAAGSIVTKNIPPYSIFIGNCIVKNRFDEQTVRRLKQFDYSSLTETSLIENIDKITEKMSDEFFLSEFYRGNLKEQ